MDNHELKHYGVLGMKWGIRKERLSIKTKSGDTITLNEHPSSRLASFLAKHSKKAAAEQEKTALFDIKDKDGKTVGDITLYKESPTSINVVWVTTDNSVRGRGYGTAVMKSAIQIAKDTGAKQVTLEVPGQSPDARHIYEKLGFKEVDSPERDESDIWGGLTNMRLDLDDIKHSSSKEGSLMSVSTDIAKKYIQYLAEEIDQLDSEDGLKHYGVLGMKWGIRRSESQLARSRGKSSSEPSHEDYSRAHTSKSVKSMSDKELRDRIIRLQMEKQYKQLNTKDVSAGRKFVQGVMVNAAKQTATNYVSKAMSKGVDAAITSMLKKR